MTIIVPDPLFKSVFGNCWDRLPRVIKRHYANRAWHDDIVSVTGLMRVETSFLGRMLKPFFRLMGTLVPHEGNDIPVTVDFTTLRTSPLFHFDRRFHFPGRKPYHFRSAMLSTGNGEVVELTRFNFGWHCIYAWTDNKVVLSHKGYVVKWFGTLIPLPIDMLIGRGHAEEYAIDDDSFGMTMEIRHRFWGKVFGYSGIFHIIKDA